MHLLPILNIAISIKMSVVWQSNCRPGCIQFAPAAWPCLAVVWNETSCVLMSTFSAMESYMNPYWWLCRFCELWHWIPFAADFSSSKENCSVCAQLCHASQNTWNNSYLGCLTCQELKIKTGEQPSEGAASSCGSSNHWAVTLQCNQSCSTYVDFE